MNVAFRPLDLVPLHPLFAAEVRGVDLAALDEATFQAIRRAFDEHVVLVFRGQKLDDDAQVAFSERFGPLELSVRRHRPRATARPDISDIANVDPDGNVLPLAHEQNAYNVANQLWHSDSSFKRVPAYASLLHARVVPPEGGETEFCDMRAAWEALPEALRQRVEGRVAWHSLAHSRAKTGYGEFTEAERDEVPPVPQAMVRTHPATGRRALYVGSHAFRVDGLADDEARRLVAELVDFATAPERIFVHRWQAGDLVMWDNRMVVHRGRPWDMARHPRVMRRTTVAGDGPTA